MQTSNDNQIWEWLQRYSLPISLFIISLCFLVFYPARNATVDEQSYLLNAKLITQGKWVNDCNLTDSAGQFHIGDNCVSKYNIGTSFFLIPAVYLGDRSAFLITLIVFLTGIVVFSLILNEMKLSPILVWLYALFPAFSYFSRTLLSETYSATLVLLVAYFLLKYLKTDKMRWAIGIGFASGVAILVRYTNVLPLGLFIGLTLITSHPTLKPLLRKTLPILLAFLPWVIITLAINWLSYGNPFSTGYALSGEQGVFIFSQVPLFLVRFLIYLCIFYPMMFFTPLITKTKLDLGIWIGTVALILFYSGFPNTVFEGKITDLILGLRFLIPIIPLLLISYANFLNQRLKSSMDQYLYIFAVITLVCISVAINFMHQSFLLK